MSIGYPEKEIGRMYLSKWNRLFEKYRENWNMQMQKRMYQEKEEITSILEL